MNHAMANDARQERQLMRQRGAGSRQINNIDFGFAFNTPSQLRRSRTRSQTPQTATNNRRHSLITPDGTARNVIHAQPSRAHSARRVRSAGTDDKDEGALSLGRPPLKRRRLSEVSNLSNVTNIVPILHIANESIDEGEEDLNDKAERGGADENTEGAKHTSRDASGEDKENNVNPLSSNGLGPKRRKRKSIGQQRTKRKRPSVDPAIQNPIPEEIRSHTEEDSNDAAHDKQTNELEGSAESSAITPTQGQEDATLRRPVDLRTAQSVKSSVIPGGALLPKEKRKKKSSLFTRKKRRSTGSTNNTFISSNTDISQIFGNETPASAQERGREDRSDSGLGDEQEQADHETLGDLAHLLHDQAKESKGDEDKVQSNDSEASDQEYHPDEASPAPTPAPSRRTKPIQANQKFKTRSKNINARNTKEKRSTSTFPVLTHRVTNVQQLPTIHEASEGEEANELEPPAYASSFTTRDAPNAVDVLAQICRETVDSTIAGLQNRSQTENISKALMKQKLEALQNFRAELDNRLFDASQSLDQRLQLEARLRKSRREKALVQARWLDVRKRRDQIALRIDAVRRRHWENEVVGRKAWEASEAAMRLEAEVQKGGDAEDDQADHMACASGEQLEIMLRNLTGDVSNFNGGGILQALRGFNAQLDRFAGSFGG